MTKIYPSTKDPYPAITKKFLVWKINLLYKPTFVGSFLDNFFDSVLNFSQFKISSTGFILTILLYKDLEILVKSD